RWPADAVRRVAQAGPGGPVRLSCTGREGARLIIPDPDGLRVLTEVLPNLPLQEDGSRSAWRLVLWGVSAVAAVAFIVVVAIPRFAGEIAALVPPAWEEKLGANVSEQVVWLLAQMEDQPVATTTCRSRAGLAALAKMEGRLAGALADDTDFRIRLIDVDLPNAFALPGGHIIVTRGMVEFAGSPEALAGVLAHEMGHSVHRHPTEALLRTAGTSFLLGLLVGDVAGGATILAVGHHMLEAGYTREAEQAADAFSISLLQRAEIDPRPSADLFDRFAGDEGAEGGVLDFFATHPPSYQRAARFREGSLGDGPEVLSPAEWRAFRDACD
ncbi:MAG TPA: M48 family metallopeptidase, partial [Alphaproteobacteria bacterium]|nr:M48 family metallopeptidase [Alphaproteobacteria bacterium]